MPRTPETASFKLNHTLLRIRDPKVSLPFYLDTLGMTILSEFNLADLTVYYLGYDHSGISELPTKEEKLNAILKREGGLELMHHHGTESDPNFQGYANGNTDPGKGFRHIAITVDDVEGACARFEQLGVPFQERLSDGELKHVAFLLDPDGYWVEIISNSR